MAETLKGLDKKSYVWRRPGAMGDRDIASKFLADIGINNSFAEDVSCFDLRCDYLGFDAENWYIVEVKSSISDLERAIPQILRYYHGLKYSKYNSNPCCGELNYISKYPVKYHELLSKEDFYKFKRLKNPIPLGRKDIKLFILFTNCLKVNGFIEYYSIYRDYLDNQNCPIINFYYLDENQEPVKLYGFGGTEKGI